MGAELIHTSSQGFRLDHLERLEMVTLGNVKEGEDTELLSASVFVGSVGEKSGELLVWFHRLSTTSRHGYTSNWACLHVCWVTQRLLVQQGLVLWQAEDTGQQNDWLGRTWPPWYRETGH